MEEKITLREWIGRFDAGEFDTPDVDTQIDAGWYDWFCRDTSLARKTQVLGKKVKQIAASDRFNRDRVYVFFKNNCPMAGSLYDDFRICDLESGDVLFTVIPRSGSGKAEVWGRENNFAEPLVSGTWWNVKEFFGVK